MVESKLTNKIYTNHPPALRTSSINKKFGVGETSTTVRVGENISISINMIACFDLASFYFVSDQIHSSLLYPVRMSKQTNTCKICRPYNIRISTTITGILIFFFWGILWLATLVYFSNWHYQIEFMNSIQSHLYISIVSIDTCKDKALYHIQPRMWWKSYLLALEESGIRSGKHIVQLQEIYLPLNN